MPIHSKYNPKTGNLTITCDTKDVILAFGTLDNYYKFLDDLCKMIQYNML